MEADPVRLAEILANLVTNAVRHSPRGGRVTVRVSRASDGTVFEVRDAGPGIPADQLPTIFDRFVTADAGGTGLGLAIARRLVEAHGGTIMAVSPAGGGTTMHLVIPG
jgi:signal transduction histidine kinase